MSAELKLLAGLATIIWGARDQRASEVSVTLSRQQELGEAVAEAMENPLGSQKRDAAIERALGIAQSKFEVPVIGSNEVRYGSTPQINANLDKRFRDQGEKRNIDPNIIKVGQSNQTVNARITDLHDSPGELVAALSQRIMAQARNKSGLTPIPSPEQQRKAEAAAHQKMASEIVDTVVNAMRGNGAPEQIQQEMTRALHRISQGDNIERSLSYSEIKPATATTSTVSRFFALVDKDYNPYTLPLKSADGRSIAGTISLPERFAQPHELINALSKKIGEQMRIAPIEVDASGKIIRGAAPAKAAEAPAGEVVADTAVPAAAAREATVPAAAGAALAAAVKGEAPTPPVATPAAAAAPTAPAVAAAAPPALPAARTVGSLSKDEIQAMQLRLQELHYPTGAKNGVAFAKGGATAAQMDAIPGPVTKGSLGLIAQAHNKSVEEMVGLLVNGTPEQVAALTKKGTQRIEVAAIKMTPEQKAAHDVAQAGQVNLASVLQQGNILAGVGVNTGLPPALGLNGLQLGGIGMMPLIEPAALPVVVADVSRESNVR
jgi:hypothetical protein